MDCQGPSKRRKECRNSSAGGSQRSGNQYQRDEGLFVSVSDLFQRKVKGSVSALTILRCLAVPSRPSRASLRGSDELRAAGNAMYRTTEPKTSECNKIQSSGTWQSLYISIGP